MNFTLYQQRIWIRLLYRLRRQQRWRDAVKYGRVDLGEAGA